MRIVREQLRSFCRSTGVRDSAYLRDRHTVIDLFTETGDKLVCPKPWDTLAIHPNGDLYCCMAWSRPPIGNLAMNSFAELWTGAPLKSLREEFERRQAGVDCLNCTIRRDVHDDPDDDFFYRKLAKPPAPHVAP